MKKYTHICTYKLSPMPIASEATKMSCSSLGLLNLAACSILVAMRGKVQTNY